MSLPEPLHEQGKVARIEVREGLRPEIVGQLVQPPWAADDHDAVPAADAVLGPERTQHLGHVGPGEIGDAHADGVPPVDERVVEVYLGR